MGVKDGPVLTTAPADGDWTVKGEGGANVVFEYAGHDTPWRGKVLRVAKSGKQGNNQTVSERCLEAAVWTGVQGMDVADDLKKALSYVRNVLAPCLGEQYVCKEDIVDIPKELSAWCTAGEQCLLQPDHTLFNEDELRGWQVAGPVLSFEIKPKMGFVPNSPAIHPLHEIKTRVPRFVLQQYLKLKQNNLRMFMDGSQIQPDAQGLVEVASKLPSRGAVGQMCGAASVGSISFLVDVIVAILCREDLLPRLLRLQRLDTLDIEGVFPVYKNCLQLYGDTAEDQAPYPITPRAPSNRCRHGWSGDMAVQGHFDRLSHIISGGCGFEENAVLLSTSEQRGRAEASKPLYMNSCGAAGSSLRSREKMGGTYAVAAGNTRNTPVERHQALLHELQNLPQHTALSILRDYLIASTVKDCSIFVTLQQVCRVDGNETRTLASGNHGTDFPKLYRSVESVLDFVYKVAVVDLDLKHVCKIPVHYDKDRLILDNALRMGVGK